MNSPRIRGDDPVLSNGKQVNKNEYLQKCKLGVDC